MSRIKYMGAADKRRFLAGEDFGGRLATPLPRDVTLEWKNRHIIDTDAPEHRDLPRGFFQLLAAEPGFMDVTDHDVVPLNDAERLWKGQRDPHDTRWARPTNEVLTGSRVDGVPELVQYSEKYPTVLSPPPDLLRPAGQRPNDDIEPDDGPNGNGNADEPFTEGAENEDDDTDDDD